MYPKFLHSLLKITATETVEQEPSSTNHKNLKNVRLCFFCSFFHKIDITGPKTLKMHARHRVMAKAKFELESLAFLA